MKYHPFIHPSNSRLLVSLSATSALFISLCGTGSHAAELMANGNFSANASNFTVFPGYVGGSNPVAPTSWSTSGDGTGLNGTLTGGAGSAFAPATNVGSFVFLQGSDRSVSQAINTVATTDYQFTFDAAARSGTGPSGVSVFADATQPASLVLDGTGTNYGWLNQSAFQHYTFGFVATAAQTIRLSSSSNTGDHTTDITNVSVTDLASAKYAVGNATVFFTNSGTSVNGFALTGNNQTIYQRSGAATYTGNITTDGSGGSLDIKSYGWQAGTATLTFSGSLIALGAKSLQTNGQNGGNVDVLDHANLARITMNDVTFSTDADVVLGNKALHFTGSTQATIGGQIRAINAWNDFTLGGTAAVVVNGGVDFKNIASHLELNGGTLTTPFIWGNTTFSGASRTILNGTRIIASADSADFLKVSNDFDNAAHGAAAVIGNGGAVFDTDGHNVTIANVLADLSGNTGTLTKLGTGTLALTSANTYTGATDVSLGKLIVGVFGTGGSLTSNVAVASGATVGGSGTITGNVSLSSGGSLAAGNSPGILTVNGTSTFNSGSIFSWELNSDVDHNGLATEGNRGTHYDGLTSTNLSVASGAIFRVILTGTADLASAFWDQAQTWNNIFSVSGSTTEAATGHLFNAFQVYTGSTDITTGTSTAQGSFTMNGSTLTWTAVPEPSSALAGLLVATGLFRRRR